MPSPRSASPICSTSRISSARPSSTLPALQVFPFTLPRLVMVAPSQQRLPWPAVLSRRRMEWVQTVLYMDGITEARDARGEFFDEDRLRESLLANQGQPAATIRDAILGAVDEFVGDAPQSDDIALVVVAREG